MSYIHNQSSKFPSGEEKISPGQEVAQIDEFAMLFVFNIDDPPPILPPTDALPINYDRALGPNNCERDHRLRSIASVTRPFRRKNGVFAYPDLGVNLNLFIICLLGVEGVQTDVVVNELGANLQDNSRSVHILYVGIHSPSASGT